jgi:ABC-type transporter Mla subunit MlaD
VIAVCRRCNTSDEHAQQLASALQVLQQEAAELQAQLARAEDNQQAAAAQMCQVLSINRNLQVRLLHIELLQRCYTVPCALLLQVNQ